MVTEQEFKKMKMERDHYDRKYGALCHDHLNLMSENRILEEHIEHLEKRIRELKGKVKQSQKPKKTGRSTSKKILKVIKGGAQ